MKVCPQCRSEYPDQSTFCRQDGAALVAQAAAVAAAPTEKVPVTIPSATSAPMNYLEPETSAHIVAPLPPSANGFLLKPPPPTNGPVSGSASKVSNDPRPQMVETVPGPPAVCRKCRELLDVNDPFCASCGTPAATVQAPCSHCGQQHPADQRFCPKTGRVTRATPLQRAGKTPLYAALAALAAVILFLGTYFTFQHFRSSSATGTQSSSTTPGSSPTNPVSPAVTTLPAPLVGKSPTPPTPLPMKVAPTAVATPAITTFTDGVANASSFESPHYPRLAFDGDQNTIWHTEEYQNAWISVKYPTPRHVTQISMIGGSLRQFNESARIKDVRLRFSSGETQPLHLDDVQQMQTKNLLHSVLTTSIQFEFVGLYPGKTMHLIIPEIVVRGYKQ